MSLDWQVDGIENYKEVCWIPTGEHDSDGEPLTRMNPVTEALIWGTISVGMGQITDKNVDEFAARFRVIEKIHGAMLYKPNPEGKGKLDWYLSDEDFIAHIGLWCNVSYETRPAWASRIFVKNMTSVTEEIRCQFVRDRKKEKTA